MRKAISFSPPTRAISCSTRRRSISSMRARGGRFGVGTVMGQGGRVASQVGDYDPHLPLIIDPVLTYSSYLGGSRDERAGGVAVDAQGRTYLAGLAWAANFPMSGPPAFTHG